MMVKGIWSRCLARQLSWMRLPSALRGSYKARLGLTLRSGRDESLRDDLPIEILEHVYPTCSVETNEEGECAFCGLVHRQRVSEGSLHEPRANVLGSVDGDVFDRDVFDSLFRKLDVSAEHGRRRAQRIPGLLNGKHIETADGALADHRCLELDGEIEDGPIRPSVRIGEDFVGGLPHQVGEHANRVAIGIDVDRLDGRISVLLVREQIAGDGTGPEHL